VKVGYEVINNMQMQISLLKPGHWKEKLYYFLCIYQRIGNLWAFLVTLILRFWMFNSLMSYSPRLLQCWSILPSQVANIFPHRCFPSLIIVIYIYFQPLDDSSLDYKVMHGL